MKRGAVGIMPPGALGVAFFYHLTEKLTRLDGSVFFVGVDGSHSIDALLCGNLQILAGGEMHTLPAKQYLYRTLDEAWQTDGLPEILIVCPNPDKLLSVVETVVTLIEKICERDGGPDHLELPAIILCANGIYFQRIRQMFVEKLEESILLGRLPDLWPHQMPRIVGHLLRGVTIQTGLREGSGPGAIYRPGGRGHSTLTGGGDAVRSRCAEVLSRLGGWFEIAPSGTPTRFEFEKAILNLIVNLIGLLHAVDQEGTFRQKRIGDILIPENDAEIRELAWHVFDVGLAVKAFSPKDDFEILLTSLLSRFDEIRPHIPSSIQAVGLKIKQGTLEAKFPPTEAWLIDPLIRYARSAGLELAVAYFQDLREAVLESLRKAAAGQQSAATE